MTPSAAAIGSYSYGERLLRLCTFQAGIYSHEYPGWFEKIIHRIYLIFSEGTCSPQHFDKERAQRSLDAFQRLGGEIEFIQSKDNLATIQMLCFQADKFRSKLEGLGAKWELIKEEERQIFAIIPSASEDTEWRSFEQDMLSRFKWARREVQGRMVIVTCENADHIDIKSPPKLFVHVNSASTVFCMLGQRIGFWLGCQQDIAVYDPRETYKSTGSFPSEAGYYSDAEAVLEHVLKKKPYSLENVWVTSACGGSCVAAHLKQKYHTEKINLMVESGYVNLDEDFFAHQSWLPRWFAFHFYSGLKSRDIPENSFMPKETGFRIEDLWKDLEKKEAGRVVVVYPENDQYLRTPQTPNKMIELAQKVNTEVITISFVSKRKNAHRDRFYRYQKPRDKVLETVFMEK